MESRHLLKNVNVSLRKVRMFLPGVKKMTPPEAVERLAFMPHSAARILVKAISTAIANAELSLKVPKNMLEFRCLKADQGLVLKRFRAGSRGTALPISRRMTHITIVLGIKSGSVVAQKTEIKSEKVAKVKKEEKASETKVDNKKTSKKTVKKSQVKKEEVKVEAKS